MAKLAKLHVAILKGYIVSANEDGSVPLNSVVLAKVDTLTGAEVLVKAINQDTGPIKRAAELMLSVAQNDYMIDGRYLPVGDDLLKAVTDLETLLAQSAP